MTLTATPTAHNGSTMISRAPWGRRRSSVVPVDGFADDYLPTIDDEYDAPIPVAAHELTHGDLVDVSVDGVAHWTYVHAEPYHTEDADGLDSARDPYRGIDDGQDIGDIDVRSLRGDCRLGNCYMH